MRREFDHLIYSSADKLATITFAEAMRAYRENRKGQWT